MARLQLEIVTAEGSVFSGEVDSVTAPGADGQLTILPSHASLITSLADGELKYIDSGSDHFVALLGGFMEVNRNRVTVLANAAEDEGEIDEQRAEEAMNRARERLAAHTEEVDIELALAALRRARARLTVARSRRRSGRADSTIPVSPPSRT
jgi:F-type H+-transporting ATPase subunit epsilon